MAKVTLAAIHGYRTIAELARAYGIQDSGIHANQIHAWKKLKKQPSDGAAGVLEGSVAAAGTATEAEVGFLYRQIGLPKC